MQLRSNACARRADDVRVRLCEGDLRYAVHGTGRNVVVRFSSPFLLALPRCFLLVSGFKMTNLFNTRPKKFGPGSRQCRVCFNRHGMVRKYGLMMCRQCFRERAGQIGFVKYR
ncbi:40s ribosomal protein s29 [Cystoisospora suis]|uniref:40s ribosomal protein s29 n=1 Tax=Cystoisospora suis TaxID=483139 RepID=A0A2C6L3Q7_9APIC|nr:40s ribosomal protein s29 [Cystoisospora suis]